MNRLDEVLFQIRRRLFGIIPEPKLGFIYFDYKFAAFLSLFI
jgi:hypothetical protein